MELSKKFVCAFTMLVLLFASSSSFAAVCADAKITLVGPNTAFPGDTAMQITCVSGGTNWTAGTASISMSVHPDVTDQVLATAFTAIALGQNVYINATPGAANGIVTGMYLLNR